MNNSSLDFIITLLVDNIENYYKSEFNLKYPYELNRYTNFEIEKIQMNIYIHKNIENNTYYYKLSAKNLWYINENGKIKEFNLFTSSEFDSILDLLENITYVKMNYTFYEKMLCSPKQKEKIYKLKKSLSLFPNKDVCSICYEPTYQTTVCNHPICLHCREKCIQSQNYNCPICRTPKLRILPFNLFTL